MTISHRAPADASAAANSSKPVKVARMACCCKLSELLPIVQQLHREAATTRVARATSRSEAA
ncbi:hypothetical protein [Hymenobacter tenuis]